MTIEEGTPLEQDIHSEEFNPFDEKTEGEGQGGETGADGPGEDSPVQGKSDSDGDSSPSDQNAEPKDGEQVYDIPGYGKVAESDLRGILTQQAVYQDLQTQKQEMEAQRAQLESLTGDLSEAMELQKLLDYGDVRSRIQQALSEAFSQAGDLNPNPDGNRAQFMKDVLGREPKASGQVDPALEQELSELRSELGQIRSERTSAQVDQVFEGYSQKYPNVVDQAFKDRVMDEVILAYKDRPNDLGIQDLDAAIGKRVLETLAANDFQVSKEMAEALKDQPPGTRVVKGNNTRLAATPKLPDPKKMEWTDLEAEGAKEFFVDEAAG